MNTVTVEFRGICTHVPRDPQIELPVPHRVVLVNASSPTYINGVTIARHHAALTLFHDRHIRLEGVRLWLEVESGTVPPFDPCLCELPHLKDLMHSVEPLSPPAQRMVVEQHADEVACFFDITFGTLTGFIDESQTAYATLVAQSEGTFLLHAEAFPDGQLPAHVTWPLPLASGHTTITVSNNDIGPATKKAADFLLHYRLAERMPGVPQVPQLRAPAPVPGQQSPPHGYGTIGAGCSNSTYP